LSALPNKRFDPTPPVGTDVIVSQGGKGEKKVTAGLRGKNRRGDVFS
jgi:hypothetical protein